MENLLLRAYRVKFVESAVDINISFAIYIRGEAAHVLSFKENS